MKKRLLTALIPAAVCLATAGPALASTSTEEVSENWAGYEATTQSGDGYSAASGSWTEPTVTCVAGEATYSAFWVGLGGGDESSDALEQEGTQADCSADGKVSYYAWYELVPSAPVKLSLKLSAGDVIYARTVVKADEVTVKVADRTTGKTFVKTIEMTAATPDTSTAEWVAEAPSECRSGSLSDCTPLPLSNFGTVKFTKAYATSDGYTGKVEHWSAIPIALESSSSDLYGGGYGGGYSGGYPGSSVGSSGLGGAAGSLGGYGGGDGYYYDSAAWADSYGLDPYAYVQQASDTASGDAAPSALTDDGTAFSVVYGQEPSADASSGGSSTGSSSGLGNSSSGDSGTDPGTGSSSDGYGYGDGYGSGYGEDGYGYGSYGYPYGGGYGGSSYGGGF